MFRFDERLDLINTALAREKADLVIKNGKIVNVNTGEILTGLDIAIRGRRIALIGDTANLIGEKTKIINARGYYLVPGLIDAHVHVESSMLTLTEFAKVVLPHGTTSIFIDPHEITNVLGLRAIKLFIDEAKNLPLKVFIEIPSCVPSAPGIETPGAEIGPKEVEEGLKLEGVVGLAEMMNFPGVLLKEKGVIEKLKRAYRMRKVIEGHAPLLTGADLNAYIASGISSDHESTTAEEALEKLRLGMKLEIREGSTARNLSDIIKPLLEGKIDTRHCLLATDDRHPRDLIEEGHMDYVVRKAIKMGLDPVKAIQMATINVAEHFNVDLEIGSISPGRIADILFVEDINEFSVEKVIANGRLVAEKGKILVKIPKFKYPEYALKTINLRPIEAKDFRITCPEKEGAVVKVRVIGIIEGQAITDHKIVKLRAINGLLRADVSRDILKIAVVERHKATGNIGRGFVQGFGLKKGAIASSVAHDAHNIVVVGADERDMACAVNALRESGGGQVVVINNKVIALLPLPIAGLMSEKSIEEVNREVLDLEVAAKETGVKINHPFMHLSFLSLPVIPKLKITDKGLFDVEKFSFVKLIVSDEKST